jgi:hypothetical protein
LNKILHLKACFADISAKDALFNKIIIFNLVFQLFIEENMAFIWTFFIFEDLAFFETAYGKI